MATFSDKLRRLMRDHGETTRSLGAAVGATSGAVTGWTNGAMPRPDAMRRLADYFGVKVEDLLDEARELPGSVETELLEENQATYGLALGPIKTAAALAREAIAILKR